MSNRREETTVEYFQEIEIEKPADLIIRQIQGLISSGRLKPGMRLPSERVLAQRLGVGRGHIREALRKLEFYGVLKTLPQRGTIVASLGVKALEGLISNILTLTHRDFDSLMEVRTLLEVHAARLAAARAGQADLAQIDQAYQEFRAEVLAGRSGLEEDHLFHLKIAEGSHNPVLGSLIGLITPEIITLTRRLGEDQPPERRAQTTLREHERILEGVRLRDPDRAAKAMGEHMDMAHRRRANAASVQKRPRGSE